MDAAYRMKRPTDTPIAPVPHGDRVFNTRIRCHSVQSLRQVFIGLASICYVQRGKKRVHWNSRNLFSGPDELLLIAPGTEMNVGNLPKGGEYLADMVSIPPAVIERFRQRYPGQGAQGKPPASLTTMPHNPDILRAWRYLQESLHEQAAPELQSQAAESLLLALSLSGPVGALLQDRSDPMSIRIEQRLHMLPPEQRTLECVADAFHCSVSTLRRRLAREQTGFRRLLDNVQLGQALEQLQTSSLPIAEIAASCGYESASRFSIRFRQHYGLSPSELRQTRQ
ncbi:MAG: Urease operon transcriptional activator [Herbaspirillum frisingense]|uniref:Urease operon transcriptional activator n=1 Tax=Herbaspirillum frisingense TaxID=92645 RepID=A0A7V8FUT0_9BURK|nr:MAG: Urease operon transcriptional activator [Herbaspirillum frisingense]